MTDNVIDVRERFADPDELYETIKDAVLARLPRSGPVMLSEDSKDGHTAQLQPTVKAIRRKMEGGMEEVTLPVIPDVPIYYASGNDITATFGQKKGQEGFIVPAAISIDGWHQQSGIQSPGDVRQHALADSFFVPGLRSDPNKLKGVSPDAQETRTGDKQSLHSISHTAITTVREDSAHQVNGMAIQAEKGGSQHVVDAKTIQHVASKILLNC